jgi:carbon starvation protein CstA
MNKTVVLVGLITIVACFALIAFALWRNERWSRSSIAGSLATMSLCAGMIAGTLTRYEGAGNVVEWVFIGIALCFFALDVRFWRADKHFILGTKPD